MAMNRYILCHHGIIGQKWGIRRFQNKDGTLTAEGRRHYKTNDYVFEKGMQFNTTVAINPYRPYSRSKKDPTYVYDAENKRDSAIYKGPFVTYRLRRGAKYIYTKKYEAVKDLKSPSDDKRVEIFLETYKKHPAVFEKTANKAMSSVKDMAAQGHNLNGYLKTLSEGNSLTKKSSDDDIKKYGYIGFNVASELKSDKNVKKAYDLYYKNVTKKGYDAIIDDNNKDVYNNASTPLIILKNTSIKEIGNTPMTQKEYEDGYNYVEKYMNAMGKRVAL